MSDTPLPLGPENPKPPEEPTTGLPAAAVPSAAPDAVPPPVAGESAAQASGAPPQTPDAADVEKNKMLAALSYVGILWLVPLLAAKDSPYAKFHCNQGILLSIVAFCAWFVFIILAVVIAWIPILNICGGCILWLAFLGSMLTFVIMGVVNALNGRMKPLPFFPRIAWVK